VEWRSAEKRGKEQRGVFQTVDYSAYFADIKFKKMTHTISRQLAAFTITLLLTGATQFTCAQSQSNVVKSEDVTFAVDTVASDISIPFGMAFLPDGHMLVTDRSNGKIWKVNPKTKAKTAIANAPVVHAKGQGGMLDIALHPDFAKNGWIYLSYSAAQDGLNGTVVERFKLKNDQRTDVERLFTCSPFFKNDAHYGSRLVFDKGYLFFTIGERSALRDSAQTLTNHFGKVIRIHDDGRVPADNPFVNTPGAKPEIWSYGHRNPQGLFLNPMTGELLESEHGPKGGDELNVVKSGRNYGWPIITYGTEYSGQPINNGKTEQEGLQQPLKYYKPSIGPSGLLVYTGNEFPAWKGNVFTGALALMHLNRLVVEGGNVVKEERLFQGKNWRVRNVEQGPDGYIYFGVDGGAVMRIRPAK
jgi:glucose/arabinose dehydrogenase